MSSQKIAISVPPGFVERVDKWSAKTGKSRSRFIVEAVDKNLREIEDEEITRAYNEAYGQPEIADQDKRLAEEMLSISAVHDEEEKWY
jgi:metal-responsive CopG/Arc/MetJ family transcriptional regulator